MDLHVASSSAGLASGDSAGTMGFPMNTGSAGDTEGEGEDGAMDEEPGLGQGPKQGLGQGQGQETLLVGSEHFLDMPDKTAAVKPTSSAAVGSPAVSGASAGGAGISGSSAAASGGGSSGGSGNGSSATTTVAVADQDVYEEPDEEEVTLRLQLVELRKAYFRALRHEQSMGYQSAVTPRLALEVREVLMLFYYLFFTNHVCWFVTYFCFYLLLPINHAYIVVYPLCVCRWLIR